MTKRPGRISGGSILLLLASVLSAQEAIQERPKSEFFDTLDVNVVNLEVIVTDRRGNPVTGLGRDDFELYDDGQRIDITNFYAVEERERLEPAESQDVRELVAEVPDAPEERTQRQRRPQVPEEQRLHLVVYIDNSNIEPFHRNRVFGQLRQFLHTLDRQDRIMLVSYDRSLNIRQRFTEDTGLVTAALFDLEGLTGGRLQANRERRQMLRTIDRATSAEAVLGRTRQHAAAIMNELRFTLDSLRGMIASLAGLPGRKAVLYVSDGLPMVPGRDLFFHLQRKFEDLSAILESQQLSSTRQFQTLANQANSAGVTFYTVDASGLQSLTGANAENARASSVDGGTAFADSMNLSNLQSSIQYIAKRTGGTAIVNVNDIGRLLSRVATDFKTFYSLGFSPRGAGSGRYHSVEVKVARKGLTVRHREGYRTKSVAQQMKERTASSLRYGVQSNALAVRVGIGQVSRHETGNFVVPFLLHIPLGEIVLVPREGAHEGRLTVYYTAMDEEGGIADVQQDVISIQVPLDDLEDARQKHYTYEARLLMSRGRQLLGAGIRDEFGAKASFVSMSVDVGSR